jgi:predicted nucleotidyltransferase component of viral defense system
MREFVEGVSRSMKIGRRDLVEKDLILHRILLDLSRNESFRRNFLFKGGTCLIKGYLGYYRFSEDIDFTWRDQSVFEGMSQKEIRRYLSGVIDGIGETFEGIASGRGLDFRCDKGNRDYVELGGGNKTLTFKIWYTGIPGRRSFVKVQVNFVEDLRFPAATRTLRSLYMGDGELEALFPESGEYSQGIVFDTYDIREILCEKVRSVLTRRGTKARDFVDIYLITRKSGIGLREVEEDTVHKTRFILGMYAKYRKNFEDKVRLLASEGLFRWGEEKALLLSEIDEWEFFRFMEELNGFMGDIAQKVSG